MMPDRPGVTVPAELCRPLARLAVLGLADRARRNGASTVPPGLAALLAELDTSGKRHPVDSMEPARWLTTAEGARAAGVTERQVQRLARSGRLIARRHGWAWLIDADSARDYGRERRHGTADDDSRGTGDAGR